MLNSSHGLRRCSGLALEGWWRMRKRLLVVGGRQLEVVRDGRELLRLNVGVFDLTKRRCVRL